jgi:hypothetical protein
VRIEELARGGIVVTASRVDEEDGKTVVKLGLANAVTGNAGEARIWPDGVGRYRAKVKWAEPPAAAPALQPPPPSPPAAR